jgi:hypothetical protein
VKHQHYLGRLEGLPEPLSLEKRVFVEDRERRYFGPRPESEFGVCQIVYALGLRGSGIRRESVSE